MKFSGYTISTKFSGYTFDFHHTCTYSPAAVSSPVVNVNTKFSLSTPDSSLRRTPRLPVPTDSEKVYEGCSNPKTKSAMEW